MGDAGARARHEGESTGGGVATPGGPQGTALGYGSGKEKIGHDGVTIPRFDGLYSPGSQRRRITVAPPSAPQPIDYETLKPCGVAPARLSVVCAHLFLQFTGILTGRLLWFLFFRGQDPQVELFWANAAGFALFAILCPVFKRRLSRFRLFDALLAFALGVLSSLAGMGWGVLDGYGR
jgi:hypothetical protein